MPHRPVTPTTMVAAILLIGLSLYTVLALNLVKATFEALKQLRTREQIERLRGVSL